MKGRGWVPAFVMAALVGGCSQPPPDGAEPDGGAVEAVEPGAYQFSLDSERSDPGEFQLSRDDGTVHIMTGPAGIAYRPEDRIQTGDFQVGGTFVQYGAPVGYREAYGLFVGGRDLGTAEQEYTYLLIRGTGDFLIKRRLGDNTETLVDWTPSSAVVAVTEEVPQPENRLAITSIGGETVFLINGVAVHGMPTPEARPHGVVGIRANHRLDIRVRDWLLAPGAPTTSEADDDA